MGCIYKITNTVNGKAYIGQTRHDAVKTRIRDHLNGYGSQLVKQAVEKYGREAFTFEILHDGISPEFLDTLEQEAIQKFNTLAPHGYNLDTGGGGSKTPSEETRRKMSEAHTGRVPWNKGKTCKPLSEEHRCTISKALKGRTGNPHSVETKRKMSKAKKGKPAWNRGIPRSEETRKKMSLAQRGRSHTKETREKMSRSHRGKSPSKAHREKLSLANRGKTLSEEHRQKISEANTGRNHPNFGKSLSEGTRRKIGEAQKGENNPMKRPEVRQRTAETQLGMSPEAFTILVGWLLSDGWSKHKIARELRKSPTTIYKYAKLVSNS